MAKKKPQRAKHVVSLPQAEIKSWFTDVRDASNRFIGTCPDLYEHFLNGHLDKGFGYFSYCDWLMKSCGVFEFILFDRKDTFKWILSEDVMRNYKQFLSVAEYVGECKTTFGENSNHAHMIISYLAFGFGILRCAEADGSGRLRVMAMRCKKAIKDNAREHYGLLRQSNGRCTNRSMVECINRLDDTDNIELDSEDRKQSTWLIAREIIATLNEMLLWQDCKDSHHSKECPYDSADISFAISESVRRLGRDYSCVFPDDGKHPSGHEIAGAVGAARLLIKVFAGREHFFFPAPESLTESPFPHIYTELRTRLLVFKHTIEVASLLPDDVDPELAETLSKMLVDQLPHLTDVSKYEKNLYQLGLALEASSTALAYTKGLLDVRGYPLLTHKVRMTYHKKNPEMAICSIGKRELPIDDNLFNFFDHLVDYRSRTTNELKEHVGIENWEAVTKKVERLRNRERSKFPELFNLITPPPPGPGGKWTTDILRACDNCVSPLPIMQSLFSRNEEFRCTKCGALATGIPDVFAGDDIQDNMEPA